jgi:metallo-beta-lactamase family protein
MVILSASGMCEAGRIRHHLKHHLWNRNSSIVFVGYQAEGTLGRSLVNGVDRVTLFGEEIQVNAEIHNLEGFSGHADKNGLMDWVSGFRQEPAMIFLVHGEQEAKRALAERIWQERGYETTVVEAVSEFELGKGAAISRREMMDAFAGQEQLQKVREKIADVHGQLESILYNAQLVSGEKLPPERLLRISGAVLALEKDALNLGSAVAQLPDDHASESEARGGAVE